VGPRAGLDVEAKHKIPPSAKSQTPVIHCIAVTLLTELCKTRVVLVLFFN
jgi:hypothetical protein